MSCAMRLVRFWSSGPKSEQHKERQQSAAVDMGLEGLVSKRRDRRYQGGRPKYWVKVKNRKHPAMSLMMEAFG